jgi:hypothetical protein
LKQRPCKEYSLQEYLECSKSKFWNLFQNRSTCVVFIIKEFVPQNQTLLPQCPSEATSRSTVNISFVLVDRLTACSSNQGCALPCTTISYNLKLKYISENIWIHMNNFENFVESNNFDLYYSFETMDTEERMETLTYDLGNFLVAAGGNLGLFLGFSCFSLMVTFIEYLNHKIKTIFLKANL